MAFDLEKVCSNIKQLQALRDEHRSPKFVELALQIIALSPGTPVSEIRTIMKGKGSKGYEAALRKYVLPVVTREISRKVDEVENNDLRKPCKDDYCPMCRNQKQRVVRCCCNNLQKLGLDEHVLDALRFLDDASLSDGMRVTLHMFSKTGFDRFVQQETQPRAGTKSKTKEEMKQYTEPFSFVVREIVKKTNPFTNDGGVPNLRTVESWKVRDPTKLIQNKLSVTAFWLRTQTYLSVRDSNRLFSSAGFHLSAQYDFDLLVLYIIKDKSTHPVYVWDFDKVLNELGFQDTVSLTMRSEHSDSWENTHKNGGWAADEEYN